MLYLARRAGTVVTKQELLAEIWDQPFGGTEKTVDTHLSWLRAKLGESASAPRYLHTVRGVGIKLLAPETDDERPMRRQLVLMTLAVTSIVVIAFVLAAGVPRSDDRSRPRDQPGQRRRAIRRPAHRRQSQRRAPRSLRRPTRRRRGRISVYYADGTVVGDRRRPPAPDSLAARPAGPLVSPVVVGRQSTCSCRCSRPRARRPSCACQRANHELERGVWAAWWSLAALGASCSSAWPCSSRIAWLDRSPKPMQTLTDIARRLARR